MRMWNIDPRLLCNKHLLGEHVEMHMFIGTIKADKDVSGYISNKLLDLPCIVHRHDIIAQEMINRGMNHNSPMTEEDKRILKEYIERNEYILYSVDEKANIIDLKQRCKNCKERINNDRL